jgi:pimeloyl-ACP methyl ester carboxylesterase
MKRFVVQHQDVRISALSLGAGPKLVMLPSLGRDVEDFIAVAQIISQFGFEVILPSPRGIGGSSGPLHSISLRDLADDVARVIAHEGLATAWVAGHAFGNWVARMLAAEHPQKVRGVALLAAAQRDYPAELSGVIDRCMDTRLDRASRLQHLRHAFFSPTSDPQAWLDGWHPEIAQAQRAAAKASPREQWWSAGGKVRILDVQAEQDPFLKVQASHELANELGADRVQIIRIANASHALIPEQPAELAEVMVRWLKNENRLANHPSIHSF